MFFLLDGYKYWSRREIPVPTYVIRNHKPYLSYRRKVQYDAESIETTAYALLCYILRQEVLLEPIVRWLNIQRTTVSGWASTQVSKHHNHR